MSLYRRDGNTKVVDKEWTFTFAIRTNYLVGIYYMQKECLCRINMCKIALSCALPPFPFNNKLDCLCLLRDATAHNIAGSTTCKI